MAIIFWSCNSNRKNESEGGKPFNILFISIDDLNDWVSPLGGNVQVLTPNMDEFVKEGMLFKNAYCTSPLCNPSRVSIMTGVTPHKSGIYYNPQNMRKSEVLNSSLTIPQYFRNYGYYCAGAGKIFHNKWPDPVSWDNYWPGKKNHMPKDLKPENPNANGLFLPRSMDWAPLNVKCDSMGDMRSVNWILKQLDNTYDKPFFLACGIYRPHLPWYVPKEFFDLYPIEQIILPETINDDLSDVPDFAKILARGFGDPMDRSTQEMPIKTDHEIILENDAYKEAIQGYLASISFADHCLGILIKGLRESPYYNNTLVILWSDHGFHLGEKEKWCKETLWEEATRSLFFIRAPGITSGGSFTEWPVSLLDIYPTLIDLCSLPKKENLDGNSLVELLKNPSVKWDKPVLTTYGYKNHTIRSKEFRYIKYRDGSKELYNHINDSNEWYNLADQKEYLNVIEDFERLLPKEDMEPVPYTIPH
ncbi:MAG: sulfatase [Prolixibacteraceae bacterium]|nr:sulfatase [Prolixibacteraceae bacterium]